MKLVKHLTNNKSLIILLKEYGNIFFGALILALAYALFIVPYNIVPGGVFGLSIVVFEQTKLTSLGTIALCINIPLLIWGTKSLGKKTGLKTAFFMITSAFLLDGVLLITNSKVLIDNILLSSIFGGALVGLTIFLVKKAGATTGGQDIVARILAKKYNIDFNKLILIIDAVIILLGLITFANYTMAAYCFITIISTSKTLEYFIKKDVQNKTVLIFSKENDLVKRNLTNDKYLNENVVNIIHQDSSGKLILITKNNPKATVIENLIYNVDPSAKIITLESNLGLV